MNDATPSLQLLDDWLAQMPPVRAMGIRAAGFDGEVLRLDAPLALNLNDKRCAFGGSLVSLMTLAGWGWLMLKLREVGLQADVYVADSQTRYLAPLYQDLSAQARLEQGQDWPTIVQCLRERRRARATMVAQVDGADGSAARLSARFALIAVAAACADVA